MTAKLAARRAEWVALPLLPNTRHSAIHRTDSRALQSELVKLDGYPDARTQAAAVNDYQLAEPDIPASPAEAMCQLILGAVAAGRPIPDLDDPTVDADQVRRSYEIRFTALQMARHQLVDRLDGIIEQHAARLFARLSSSFVATIHKARALVQSGGLASADDAINAGRVEEWRALTALQVSYVDLHAGHVALLRTINDGAGIPADDPDVTFPFVVANPAEVFPDLVSTKQPSPHFGDGWSNTMVAWPESFRTAVGFRWFLDHPTATPHLATVGQASQVRQAIRQQRTSGAPGSQRSSRDTRARRLR